MRRETFLKTVILGLFCISFLNDAYVMASGDQSLRAFTFAQGVASSLKSFDRIGTSSQIHEKELSPKEECEKIGVYASFGLFYSYFIDRESADSEKLLEFMDMKTMELHWKKIKATMDSSPEPLIQPEESAGLAMGDAWELINAPSIPIQEFAMDLMIVDTFRSFIKEKSGVQNADVRTYFKNFNFQDVAYPESMAERFDDRQLEDAKQNLFEDDLLRSKFDAAKEHAENVCRLVGLNECFDGLVQIIDYSEPVEIHGGYIAPIELIRELSLHPIYLKTSIHLARRIQERLNLARQGKPIESSLFQDILESAQMAGAGAGEALEITWKLLGLYGARGASFNALDRLVLKENTPFFVAMRYVSTAITVLDSYAAKRSTNYSLPPSVKTECNFGRPYHFWYPAYLVRWLSQTSEIDPKVAEIAVYLAAVGYQFASPTTGHDIRLSFSTDQMSYYNQNIRMSLNFNAAGALFGAYLQRHTKTQPNLPLSSQMNQFKLDLNRSVQKTWKASVEVTVSEQTVEEMLIKTPLQLFIKWNALISPLTPFQVLRTQLNQK